MTRTALLLQDLHEFPSMSMKRYAASLSAALQDTARWRVEMPEVRQPTALAKWPMNAASRYGRLLKYPREVQRFRREMKPAVTHVLDHSHANLLRACDPAQSVITVHDVIPMLSVVGELGFAVKRAVRYTFPRKLRQIEQSAAVITVSEATKRSLLRFVEMPEERVHPVLSGVGDGFSPEPGEPYEDRAAERSAVLGRFGIDPARPVVLHVCTRNRYKNTPALLRMMRRLPSEFVLLRVGAAMFEDEAALGHDLGVMDRVVDAGRVAGDDGLSACYRSADVLAFPSLFEGFGWPPLEAMACGCPVVSSDAASLPEVVGDGGLRVPPEDDEALAEAVEAVVAEREAWSDRALRWSAGFTWSRAATQTAAVYDAVAAG